MCWGVNGGCHVVWGGHLHVIIPSTHVANGRTQEKPHPKRPRVVHEGTSAWSAYRLCVWVHCGATERGFWRCSTWGRCVRVQYTCLPACCIKVRSVMVKEPLRDPPDDSRYMMIPTYAHLVHFGGTRRALGVLLPRFFTHIHAIDM